MEVLLFNSLQSIFFQASLIMVEPACDTFILFHYRQTTDVIVQMFRIVFKLKEGKVCNYISTTG